MDYYSPLRYPGGKGKIADVFKEIIRDNMLLDSIYIEPYAGGASVALSLLFNEYVSEIIINDFDYSVFAFWKSAINETDALCKLVFDTPIDIENWDKQKYIQNNIPISSELEIGFSTLYLNRTNYSGILKGGIIGGRKQNGKWKLDARYNKKNIIERIERVAAYKSKICLENSDAIDLIKNIAKKHRKKYFLYLDPPYYVKGKDLYLNFYTEKNHEQVANEVKKLKNAKWVMTYDNVSFIKNLYQDFRQIPYLINYSAVKASKGKEIMVFSNDMYIPKLLKNKKSVSSNYHTTGTIHD
jgi:DNA adenine methylase